MLNSRSRWTRTQDFGNVLQVRNEGRYRDGPPKELYCEADDHGDHGHERRTVIIILEIFLDELSTNNLAFIEFFK